MVIHASLSTYAERLLTNSMRNLSGCSHIFLEILNRSRGGRPPDWDDQPEICIESQPYISFVVEESYFIIKNFKSGHFKLSSIVTMKFAGMGQWSTPLDL